MRRVALGRSGLEVPTVAFGCGPSARLMVNGERGAQVAMIRCALAAGIDLFDTAATYGAGASEAALGAALKEVAVRADVSTKVAVGVGDLGDIRSAVLRSVEASLGRLGRPEVEVLTLHNRVARERSERWLRGVGPVLGVKDFFGRNGVAEVFAELRRSGIVRCTAITTFGGDVDTVADVVRSGTVGAINASYSLLNPSAALKVARVHSEENYHNVIGLAAEHGVGVMAIRVYASGSLLSGPCKASPAERAARELAASLGGGDRAAGALRFALSTPGVSTAVLGLSEPGHLDAAVAAAAQGPLDADALSQAVAKLEALGDVDCSTAP